MSKRALLFPGQGAHKVGMGQSLHEAYDEVRALYQQAEGFVDFDLRRLSFEGPEQELRRTDVSQPAIVVASLAALRALESELGGPIPGVQACAGMSLGEYTALCYAGVLSLEDTLRLVTLRGRFMQDCCEQSPSGMTTVIGLGRAAVAKVLAEAEGVVGVANDNAPKQVVISGSEQALAAVAPKLKEAGARRLLPLKVAGAYHSRLMAAAGERLGEALAGVAVAAPRVPVLANIDGEFYGAAEGVMDRLVRQVSGTVCWRASMAALVEGGVESALELGPGTVLKGLMKSNARSIAVTTVGTADEARAAAAALADSQGS